MMDRGPGEGSDTFLGSPSEFVSCLFARRRTSFSSLDRTCLGLGLSGSRGVLAFLVF